MIDKLVHSFCVLDDMHTAARKLMTDIEDIVELQVLRMEPIVTAPENCHLRQGHNEP